MKLINMCVFTKGKREEYPFGICLYSLPLGIASIVYWLTDHAVMTAKEYAYNSCLDTGNYRLATKEDNQIIKEYYG